MAVDLGRMMELLEEKRQLLLRFEEATQVMLTCRQDQLEEQMRERQRLLDRVRQLETEMEEGCGAAGEEGRLVLSAARAKAEPSRLPGELEPVYQKGMEIRAVLSRFPESEVQAMMRLKLEQQQILELIKAANKGSAAKAARFYSAGAGQGGSSRLGRA